MKQFEDLRMWQESRELYKEMKNIFLIQSFRDYFFRDQIMRATLSIGNNIAEWFERASDAEEIRFLYYARNLCKTRR